MRIIAGIHRGRKLAVPPNADIRPTAARTREAMFNILLHHRAFDEHDLHPLPEAHIADICCGTGALGLEALSRGASFVTFVDQHGEALRHIEHTAKLLHEELRTRLIRADATNLPPPPKQHHIALLDPPYGQNLAPRILTSLAQKHWLHTPSLVVVETGERDEFTPPTGFQPLDKRDYSAATLHLLLYTG